MTGTAPRVSAGSSPSSGSRSAACSPSSSPGPSTRRLAAIAGGALTGLTVGAVQAWALRPRAGSRPGRGSARPPSASPPGSGWARPLSTTARVAADLAVQGAICGLERRCRAGDGAARTVSGRSAFLWAPALAAIWALGWTDDRRPSASTSSASTRCSARAARIVVTLADDGAAVRRWPASTTGARHERGDDGRDAEARGAWLALVGALPEPVRDRPRQHDRQRCAPHAGA